MVTQQQLRDDYHREAARLQQRINGLKARGRAFVLGEIASFLAIIFFIVLITVSSSPTAKTVEGLLAVVMFFLYVIIRNSDVRNSHRIAETERLRKAYSHEEGYLNADFTPLDDGSRYVDVHHPFTYDLDIFGPASLYQRVNRTVTTLGADRLAHDLSTLPLTDESREQSSVLPTGDDATAWRMRFIANGVDAKIDTGAIRSSLPHLQRVAIPAVFGGNVLKVVSWLLAAGLLAAIIAAIYSLVNPLLPILWLFVNFFLVQALTGRHLKAMQKAGGQLLSQMQPLRRLLRVINDGQERPDDVTALTDSFERLTAIVDTLTLRGNDAYRFFSDAFGLRGIFLVAKFYHWRTIAADNLPQWIDSITAMDVAVSKAQFAANHPEASHATVVDSPQVVYEARDLWHPFLGGKAVRNDVSLKDRNFYIVTGANMAGKSTFLRTVGINYVLAMNAMPVFAKRLTVSRFHLFTSMRTNDDLTHGISYFNAELLRLHQLLDSLSADAPTLIILDEILRGTNSLDKLNGSRMFLRAMEKEPVTGIIATHDLELSKMEQESPVFHNFCFEIALGNDVTYSYKITSGVARNQNASFLLRKLLGQKAADSNTAEETPQDGHHNEKL